MIPISVVGLFCDDIREEKSGADTLVGVMPDNINVPNTPLVFSKLSLYVRILVASTSKAQKFSLILRPLAGEDRVIQTFEESVVAENLKLATASGFPYVGLVTRATFPNFLVPGPGRIDAVVKWEDQETVCAALNFQLENVDRGV